MKKTIQTITLLTIFSLSACEEIDILPSKGIIEGIVTDNNGEFLTGVQITATFEAPSESGQAIPETHITTTDAEGHYRLIELWDEVSLSIDHPGFRPVFTQIDLGEGRHPEVNIMLEGSPSILAVVPSKTTLSATMQDTLIVQIEVSDTFNSGPSFYEVNLLLQNAAGITQAVVPAITISASQEQSLHEAWVTSDLQLPLGSYTLTVEAIDPDGNLHQRQVEQRISVE